MATSTRPIVFDPDLRAARAFAMAAKHQIFKAQDALANAWARHARRVDKGERRPAHRKLLERLEFDLGRARTALEDLDSAASSAMDAMEADHG